MGNGLEEKKTREQERAALHKALWGVANILRGVVDGWDFKQYTLGAMLYRFLSDRIEGFINEMERQVAGDSGFSYAAMKDEVAEQARSAVTDALGFFILPSDLFSNVCGRAREDADLNLTLDRVFRHIEESVAGQRSEESLSGLFKNFDVNSDKLGKELSDRNKILADLLQKVAELDFGGEYGRSRIDAFGDAYEYLMALYASNAGKSGGEYFTPPEVSELLARLALLGKDEIRDVYDPACGSGGLLLKVIKVLKEKAEARKAFTSNVPLPQFFGQEKNSTTYDLCRANMLLHGVGYEKFHIAYGDTLVHPMHGIESNEVVRRFEAIVSNPPYSTTWEGADNAVLAGDVRFAPAGVLAPKGKADFAFVMHSLALLAEDGAAAIVCFPGLFYRGGREGKIRQYLVDGNYVDCVVQLPPNLFYGTGIATCILVLKKNRADTSVLFIDAGREFVRVAPKNKLSDENVANIVKLYAEHRDVPHLSRLVPAEEITKAKYNLSVSTYVEQKEEKEEIDVKALNMQLRDVVEQELLLRQKIDEIIAEIEGGE